MHKSFLIKYKMTASTLRPMIKKQTARTGSHIANCSREKKKKIKLYVYICFKNYNSSHVDYNLRIFTLYISRWQVFPPVIADGNRFKCGSSGEINICRQNN